MEAVIVAREKLIALKIQYIQFANVVNSFAKSTTTTCEDLYNYINAKNEVERIEGRFMDAYRNYAALKNSFREDLILINYKPREDHQWSLHQ